MSTETANEESVEFSLTKAVMDVSNHGYAQMEAIKEKIRTLSKLKTALFDVDKKIMAANQELRFKKRQILMLEGELELLNQQTKAVHDRCVFFAKENMKKKARVHEENESHSLMVVKFDNYREKMALYRDAVLREMSQTEVLKELEKKKELVQMLIEKRDELKKDLEKENGIAAQNAKQKIENLKMAVAEKRAIIAEKRGKLKKQTEINKELKKGIEIQTRRHEAIIKRLRCQVGRAQAARRQMSIEVHHLQTKLDMLKKSTKKLKKY